MDYLYREGHTFPKKPAKYTGQQTKKPEHQVSTIFRPCVQDVNTISIKCYAAIFKHIFKYTKGDIAEGAFTANHSIRDLRESRHHQPSFGGLARSYRCSK